MSALSITTTSKIIRVMNRRWMGRHPRFCCGRFVTEVSNAYLFDKPRNHSHNQSMSRLTEKVVLDALRQIKDPDLHKDIVTLGFIKDLSINGGVVSFRIVLTTPACPVKAEM